MIMQCVLTLVVRQHAVFGGAGSNDIVAGERLRSYGTDPLTGRYMKPQPGCSLVTSPCKIYRLLT